MIRIDTCITNDDQRHANPEYADMLDMFNRRPQVLAKEMKRDATN